MAKIIEGAPAIREVISLTDFPPCPRSLRLSVRQQGKKPASFILSKRIARQIRDSLKKSAWRLTTT
jgi:hypothetical protein